MCFKYTSGQRLHHTRVPPTDHGGPKYPPYDSPERTSTTTCRDPKGTQGGAAQGSRASATAPGRLGTGRSHARPSPPGKPPAHVPGAGRVSPRNPRSGLPTFSRNLSDTPSPFWRRVLNTSKHTRATPDSPGPREYSASNPRQSQAIPAQSRQSRAIPRTPAHSDALPAIRSPSSPPFNICKNRHLNLSNDHSS